MNYIDAFKTYQPRNEQEANDLKLILQFIGHNPDALERTNLAAHVTASAFIVNHTFDQILFVFHNIYGSWSWVGGHNDGDPDLLKVAMQEAMEETGLKHVTPYQEDIFTVDVIYVPNHIKHGAYVPDHLHLNATYLLIADDQDEIAIKHDENSGVRWFDLDDVLNHVSEPRMVPVYQKALEAIKKIKESTK